MEILGIPSHEMIDLSRKKEHYFDAEYSPFLIEDEDLGILRIPNEKTLEEVLKCRDKQFIDFIKVRLLL